MGSTRTTAVFGIYVSAEFAQTALDDLVNSGFACSDISILLPDNESTRAFAVEKNTKAPEAATAGASTGGIVGGGLGLLAILGVLAIPGVGPMIAGGPILATLMGVASQRLFHGLDLLFRERRQQLSFRTVVSDPMSCDREGQRLVQVLMDDDLAPSQCGAPLGTLDLHDQVVKAYGVVLVNGALVSLREDHLQIPVPAGYKCRTPLRCRNGEAAVELGDVVIVEKVVGRFQSSDLAQAQLLRETSLPGGEVPFRASPRLRRVGRDHLHSQFLHGAAHLRRTLIVDLAPALGREPEMGPAVRIQRTEQPFCSITARRPAITAPVVSSCASCA
jgi:hypothetical protein